MSSDELIGKGKQVMSMVEQTGEQAVHRAKEVGHQVTVKAKTSAQQVTRPGIVTKVANTSGKIMGYGLGKVAKVFTGFTSGFETGLNAGRQPEQGEQQQTELTAYLSQQRQEVPKANMLEKEKIERKVTKEID